MGELGICGKDLIPIFCNNNWNIIHFLLNYYKFVFIYNTLYLYNYNNVIPTPSTHDYNMIKKIGYNCKYKFCLIFFLYILNL
jgi:hypothetical protein